MAALWTHVALLRTLVVLNFYNVPFLVFVTLLRMLVVRPTDSGFDHRALLLTYTALTVGAVASLGYGAVACVIVMYRAYEQPGVGGLVYHAAAILLLVQIFSMSTTVWVLMATTFRQMWSASQRHIHHTHHIHPTSPHPTSSHQDRPYHMPVHGELVRIRGVAAPPHRIEFVSRAVVHETALVVETTAEASATWSAHPAESGACGVGDTRVALHGNHETTTEATEAVEAVEGSQFV